MPRVVRLFVRQVVVGFGLGGVFVAALVALDVGDLQRLIATSDLGLLALAMLVTFHGTVFAAAQFGIKLTLTDRPEPPADGRPALAGAKSVRQDGGGNHQVHPCRRFIPEDPLSQVGTR